MVFVVGVIKNYYNIDKKSRKGTNKNPHDSHNPLVLNIIHKNAANGGRTGSIILVNKGKKCLQFGLVVL
jgi:hypothetical protein